MATNSCSKYTLQWFDITNFRQLLAIGLRDPVCPVHGLLPHPDLHPIQSDCRHILGVFLAQQGGDTSESDSGSDHCANHDHSNGLNKLGPAKGVLCQIHRRVPGILFLHGVRLLVRYV